MNWPTIPRCNWPLVAKMGVGAIILALVAAFFALVLGCSTPPPYAKPMCPTCGKPSIRSQVWQQDEAGHKWLTESSSEGGYYHRKP